jgi:hypothetical protein
LPVEDLLTSRRSNLHFYRYLADTNLLCSSPFHNDKAHDHLIEAIAAIETHPQAIPFYFPIKSFTMSQQNHPLPPPPGQQQRPVQQRQRAKSSFSFHSHKSSGSGGKIDLHETHEEKESRRLQSKADPSMAITEAEPCKLSITWSAHN